MQTHIRKCNILSWIAKKPKPSTEILSISTDSEASQSDFSQTNESKEPSESSSSSQPDQSFIVEEKNIQVQKRPSKASMQIKAEMVEVVSEEEVDSETHALFLSPPFDKFGRKPGDLGYDKSTLYISERDLSAMTPCEEQFWRIKMEYFDTIVFFKKGKFYELFAEDAVLSAELFGLRLTKRGAMKMTGVPEMSLDLWTEKFIHKGYKVAIVDQKETSVSQNMRVKSGDARQKIIERELKEVVTDTTTSSDGIGICSLFIHEIENTEKAGITIAVFRPMESEFFVLQFEDDKELFSVKSIMKKENIKEVITNSPAVLKEKVIPIRKDTWSQDVASTIEAMGAHSLEGKKKEALEILVSYLKYLKYAFSAQLVEYTDKVKNHMQVDGRTIEMLCLVEQPNKKERDTSSLLGLIDQTKTRQGKRLLRQWIIRPLVCISQIEKRYATTEMLENIPERGLLESHLRKIGDINDFVKKAKNYKVRPEEIRRLSSSMEEVGSIHAVLLSVISRLTPQEIDLTHMQLLADKISSFGVISKITEGFDISGDIMPLSTYPELIAAEKYKQKVLDMLQVYGRKESDAAQIEFAVKRIGREHYLECRKQESSLADGKKYIPSGSTKTVARYTTSELRKLSETYLEAEEKITFLATESVSRISKRISDNDIDLKTISMGVAALDCLISFGYCKGAKPVLSDRLQIKGLLNVEHTHIPNDIEIDTENRLVVMTGPNMAGKSTFLRNISTAIVLRQIGAKVPAEQFAGPVYDRLFTRIGATDNLLEGESTFQIEMKETANILANATEKSFVIIDELGRGTSTKEGSAISMAVKEYLKKLRCTALYATHFFSAIKPTDVTMKMDYKYVINSQNHQEILYLYNLVMGICKDSCGIDICKMTKVPDSVIMRALEIKKQRAVQ
ncbi:hypothetical protein NERG_01989 [Nematocida ausubeli]|uniref:DNA mismatch repair proteins mutS family domain-containing protein n=1 Tax=Nematocida ausubeli (strain ATCC PRA-371 / ERTm2) TaxID=1913371 RepID=H8ZEG8_NEMA1|nr:hypothetical protein NERG_01989 [Nematocida ausubeli]